MNKSSIIAAALLLAISTAAFAQTATPAAAQPAAPPPARGPELKVALRAAQTALEACAKIDQKVAVTVVDSAGVTKVTLAADGAAARGVASSASKALTALAFLTPSGEPGEKAKTDEALAQKIAADPSFNTRAGGILIRVGSQVIGALGVGGARGSEKDQACAIEGLKAVQGELN
jgi:uncharacterized protein GlcG (DUF336 family)